MKFKKLMLSHAVQKKLLTAFLIDKLIEIYTMHDDHETQKDIYEKIDHTPVI